MSMLIEEVKILAANLMILGPNRSMPVAFEEWGLLIYENTC